MEEAGPSMESLWRPCCSPGWGCCGVERFQAAFPCLIIFLLIGQLSGFLCPFPHPVPSGFLGPRSKVGSSSQWAQAEVGALAGKKQSEDPSPGMGLQSPTATGSL